jgi:2-oxoglutarate dehydrogenase E2 component (dihydrolipoamide succinyltransferase)
MSIAVELPALGESVVEGTIARWLVKLGDVVELDQPVVEITTDKVDAEIPSPARGVVEKLLVAEGDTVEVGAQLMMINPDAGAAEAASRSAESKATDSSVSAPKQSGASAPAAELDVKSSELDVKSTPLAQRLAAEARVDLAEIQGTGSRGRITKADVLKHVPSEPQRAPAPAVSSRPSISRPKIASYFTYTLEPGDRVIPMSPQRKLISAHMVYSKHTSPHVGTVAEVDVTEVARVREANKRSFENDHGVKLTFLPFILHATIRALREYPALNASVLEDAIVEKRDINVGMAVETEKGLLVPVIRNADRLSLSGLATAIDDISSRARSKKLSPDELKKGSFTISNPGRKGNLYGFAIINQPQVGILRVGEMIKRPVVRTLDGEDAIVIRRMMHLALSYDHRAVDGAPANGFLYRIRELLEAAEFDL